jgi:hypothetical protein
MIDENDKDYQELRDCYEMIPHRDDPENRWMIRIIKGPYEGLLYCYGKFGIKEEAEEDQLRCKYEYEILEVPENLQQQEMDETDKEKFETYIGMIVCQILQDYWKNEEKVMKFAKRVKELQIETGESVINQEFAESLDNFSNRIKVKEDQDE